jgi:DNA replication and repair protein RecF
VYISKLNLTNFRNYGDLSLELSPHPMIFQGDNAQGKTNLLEAIWVLTTTKSHRAANERELINRSITKESLPVSRLFGEVQRSKDSITLETSLKLDKANHPDPSDDAGVVQKRIRVNGIVRRATDVVGQVNAVMFSAHDLDLISGSPSLRRRHLDLINSQIDSHYLHCLQQYNKVLTQRNRLLDLIQQRQAQPAQLEFWDKELVENGSYLIEKRRSLAAVLNGLSAAIHDRLSGGEEQLQLIYLPNVGSDSTAASEINSEFQSALQRAQSTEVSRGMTLMGPHRDELRFEVNGADMGTYGSRGQQRTIALSLRLAEASHLRDQANDPPILLLDDILSELDQTRRHCLLDTITSSQQALITATDLDHFDPSFLAQAIQFRVRQGRVERA